MKALITFVMLLLPVASALAAEAPDDAFVRGYAAALLERELKLPSASLRVERGVIVLAARDVPEAERARVVTVLSAIPGVSRVDFVPGVAPSTPTSPPRPGPSATSEPATTPQPDPRQQHYETGLMPGGQLFTALIADPRWPHFAAAYQYYLGEPGLENLGAVSFGETFTIYRNRIGPAWWEFGIQAGVFALFDLDADSKDLVNADYFVSLPVALRWDAFSALFRLYHQSSHVGDEFILRERLRDRVNLSYEAVDLKLSWDLPLGLRLYGGGGYLFDQDPSSLRPWSTQAGVEFRSPWPDPDAGWRPIAAVDLQHREENDWHTDLSVRAGVQLDGVLATRAVQLLLEYFRGHSPNGQFYRDKIEYFGLGAHFHF
jgi:hypothetical protein